MHKLKHHIKDFFPALKSGNYRIYFAGQGISLIGTWFSTVAQQWLIYPTLTSNQSMLGIINAANMIPTAVLVLLTGVIADRVNKRATVIWVQSLFAVVTLILSALIFTGKIQIWHVLLSSIITGIIFAFDMPTRNSLVIDIIDKKDLPSALSLNTGLFNAARAIGPALAGITIATVGIAPAYLIDGISFIAVIISLYMLKLPKHVRSDNHPSLFKGLKEGIDYVKTNKITAVLLALTVLVTYFSWPASVLQPIFAHDIFLSGEIGFGLMQSAYGIGAMIGAFGFAKVFENTKNIYKFISTLVFLQIIFYLLFAISPSFYFSLALLLGMGWVIASFYAILNTLLQLHVPASLRGRMIGFYSFMLFGSIPLASITTSVLIPYMNARMIVFLSTVLFALSTWAMFYVLREKMSIKLNALLSYTHYQ